MRKQAKFKETENRKIPKQKMQKLKDKIKRFEYLRKQRAAHFQGIYIALLVAALVLFVDLIAGTDIFLKIILIVGFVFIAETLYRKTLIQTQKPTFVCENLKGTVEGKPQKVGDYMVFRLRDVIYENEK